MVDLRYGANPHTTARVVAADGADQPLSWLQLIDPVGRGLSVTDLLNVDLCRYLITVLGVPAVGICKHALPVGLSLRPGDACDRYADAVAADRRSAQDGTVFVSDPLDADLAARLVREPRDLIVAPAVTSAAHEVLAGTGTPRVAIVTRGSLPQSRSIGLWGGDVITETGGPDRLATLTERLAARVTAADDVGLAWTVLTATRTNAAVAVAGGVVLGVAAGQQDGPGALELLAHRVRTRSQVSPSGTVVVATDGNLPWERPVEPLLRIGAALLALPGGHSSDGEVADTYRAAGIDVCFSGTRAFSY
jgi:phosphoribosylaminoimidazolecarboxamide formyltransferase/IMP cyclohydrolase